MNDEQSPAAATKPHKIVITGFMGTGKSSTGRLLARRLSFGFLDTDHLIEQQHGPIPKIFQDVGESGFRAIERQLAVDLASSTNVVIATGGGMLLDPANVAALGPGTLIFCLEASIEEILRRVSSRPRLRPLLGEASGREDRLVALMEERRDAYSRFESIVTDSRTASEVASILAAKIITASRSSVSEETSLDD